MKADNFFVLHFYIHCWLRKIQLITFIKIQILILDAGRVSLIIHTIFVADRFDMLFTATHYEKRDNTPNKMQDMFDNTEGKFKHPFIQKLVKALIKYRNEPNETMGIEPNSIANCD